MQELATRLEKLCQVRGVEKFSAGEMVELLEDGEEVDWIIDQVLPDVSSDARGELGQLLEEIASSVAPPPSPEGEEETVDEEGEEVAEDGDPDEELDLDDLKGMLPPGVDMQQVEQMLKSPRGALLGDFGAFCQERGVEPEMGESEMSEAMKTLHEEWLQTPRDALEGKKPTEILEGGRLFPNKIETFRREEPKVGRNDPCSCGSGKKYKKCCGRAA